MKNQFGIIMVNTTWKFMPYKLKGHRLKIALKRHIYIYIYYFFDPAGLPYKYLVFAPEVDR